MSAYLEYLLSPEWAARRKAEFAKAKGKCLGCGKRAENIHHRTYARLGHEAEGDLVALCKNCHLLAHLQHVEKADDGLWVATNTVITERRAAFGLPPVELPSEKAVSVTAKAASRAVRRQQRRARWVARRQPKVEKFFASNPAPVTAAEIEAGRTPAGGWGRKQLAAWGVPWPPPKGWKEHLMSRNTVIAVLGTDDESSEEG